MVRFYRFVLVVGVLAVILATTSPAKAASCFLLPEVMEYVCHSEPAPAAPQTFAAPDLFADSVFGRRTYARLADYADVHPEPNRNVPPVRNVGDGFLFVTVTTQLKNSAGETWYQINHGEYVHEAEIRRVQASDFQGVAISRQPERPFGWVVQNVTPSLQPDGEPNPAFVELPRFTFVEIYDAVLGAEGWLWYDIGNGQWVKQTYFSLVDVDPRPEEVGPNEFWTEVDLYEQTFAAYEGDRMVYATLISSGLNRWPTREGLFQVFERYYQNKMSGAEGKVDYYFIEDIPYIMYFDRLLGIALHGTYWHDRFGYKHSHGCVNMPIRDAEWTFNWSAGAPNDLWVWVHTSDPMDHLEVAE
ncbi:MAG TPA: L,D-transpeptidase [Anaerolineae bacterium]